jgi:hypothetical protein
MLMTTLMTMERREEARRHDKQRQRCVQTTKYIDVETNKGAAGGGVAAGEGAARDEQRQCQYIDTTNNNVVI